MNLAAGRTLRIDWSVMQSETLTGNRNRVIAYLMRNFGIIDEALQRYFAECSLLVTCQDMAMMAAIFANIGQNPVTGERDFDFQFIKYMLTVMLACGLYDYAGGWAYEVGLPAFEFMSVGSSFMRWLL